MKLWRGSSTHLQGKGITIFAIVDHSGESEKAGLKMLPTKLAIFGSPKVGTPLMPSLLDLGLPTYQTCHLRPSFLDSRGGGLRSQLERKKALIGGQSCAFIPRYTPHSIRCLSDEDLRYLNLNVWGKGVPESEKRWQHISQIHARRIMEGEAVVGGEFQSINLGFCPSALEPLANLLNRSNLMLTGDRVLASKLVRGS